MAICQNKFRMLLIVECVSWSWQSVIVHSKPQPPWKRNGTKGIQEDGRLITLYTAHLTKHIRVSPERLRTRLPVRVLLTVVRPAHYIHDIAYQIFLTGRTIHHVAWGLGRSFEITTSRLSVYGSSRTSNMTNYAAVRF